MSTKKIDYGDGSYYEGEVNEYDNPHGKGVMVWSSGARYDGGWQKGKFNGFGKMKWEDGSSYEGAWSKNRCDGFGKMVWSDGDSYEGEWHKDERHGMGKMIYTSGLVEEGLWEHDSLVSESKDKGSANSVSKSSASVNSSGVIFGSGANSVSASVISAVQTPAGADQSNDENSGKPISEAPKITLSSLFNPCPYLKLPSGAITLENGATYKGEYKEIQDGGESKKIPHGRGILRSDKEHLEGEFINGALFGYGKIIFKSEGAVYDGFAVNGIPHGKGRKTFEDGSFVEAIWLNGEIDSEIYRSDGN